MVLLLRIGEASGAEPSGAEGNGREVEVDTVLRIGRAADNDLVLADADRVLSKQHCVIRRQDGRYVLLDSSTNGTFLNDSQDRLARGHPAPLAAGDAIHLGSFTLSVVSVVIPDEGEDPPGTVAEPLGPVSYAPAPLSPPQSWVAAHPPEDIDSFLDSINRPPDAGDFLGEHAAEAWHGPAEPVAAQPDHVAPDAEAFSPPRPHREAIPDDWDPLTEIGPAGRRPAAAGAGRGDPDAAGSDGAQPQWHQDKSTGEINPVEPVAPPPSWIGESRPSAHGRRGADGRDTPGHDGRGQKWPPNHPAHAAYPDANAPQPGLQRPNAVRPADPPPLPSYAPVAPARATPALPQPVPAAATLATPAAAAATLATPVPAAATLATPAPAEGHRPALDLLLAACGLDPAALTAAQAAVAAERAGHLLRIAVDGMLQILGSRSVTKQEFGIQRTAISRGANNALKFVTTAEEALRMLLCNDIPGFLPPEDAMRETVTDINAHHLALLSGVRAAFADTFKRLDPAAIEQAVPHHAADSVVPLLRKARAWDLFRTKYAGLERALAGDGQDIFGTEFARAYASAQAAATRSRNAVAENPQDVP